ncbi:MAG: ROK family protein, partial [Candidatus Adiutrix sp.]
DSGLTTDAGVGLTDSRGGRKPLLVDLDRNKKRVMGACVGPKTAELILSDITGHELKRLYAEIGDSTQLEALSNLARDILSTTGTSPQSVMGLVVARIEPTKAGETIPSDDGLSANHLLEASLAESLGFPVKVVGATAARAFSENWFGQNPKADFFYVDLDGDLDCAVVNRGILSSLPSEFSHCYMAAVPYEGSDEALVTVGSVVSGWALLRRATLIFGAEMTVSELVRRAEGGDEKVVELFREFGYGLGSALSLVVNMAGLHRVVLGGEVVSAWPHFNVAMKIGLDRHVSAKIRKLVDVQPLKPEMQTGLLGALAMALDLWIFRTDLLHEATP